MPRKPVLDWIDTNKAAELLGTSAQWVRELIQRNKFPQRYAGRTRLLYPEKRHR